MQYERSFLPTPAFEYGHWHNGPKCNVVLLNKSGWLWCVCTTCKVACELEACCGLDGHITVESSAAPREA